MCAGFLPFCIYGSYFIQNETKKIPLRPFGRKIERIVINMSLLEIEGLTHSFGENVLYKNAKFSLNKGEHIGIVGQNGTGKSTLIKICTGQIIPDSGRIVWQPRIDRKSVV